MQQAYDAILVAGCMTDRQRILQECRTLGIDESKVFFDFELCIPAYTHPKAIRLHRSRVSILSVNGWGKKLCQRFRVPMLSPFAGCAMSAEDWLSFLESPREHLSRELVFFDRIQNADGVEFPVFRMGKDGLAVYMLEETDTKKIQREWAGRVQSMNWSDLLVMTYTDSPEMLDRFDRLPYAKKICFTSFESLLGSAFYLPKEQDGSGNDLPLWASVDRLAESARPCYDLWDMLLYGRRTSVRYA